MASRASSAFIGMASDSLSELAPDYTADSFEAWSSWLLWELEGDLDDLD